MRVHVVDLAGIHSAVGEGDRCRPSRLATIGPWLDHVVGIGGRAVAQDLGVGCRAPTPRRLGLLQYEQRRALAHDEPITCGVERACGPARVVVVAGRQRPDDVERPKGQRRQGNLAAARDRSIHSTLAQIAERLTERHRA